jgi:sucrose-6-phosphate hydrolase SacC (GH32 family)
MPGRFSFTNLYPTPTPRYTQNLRKASKEKYRPQFHFSARRGCLTDLNGPIYFNGEYHIFPGHRA